MVRKEADSRDGLVHVADSGAHGSPMFWISLTTKSDLDWLPGTSTIRTMLSDAATHRCITFLCLFYLEEPDDNADRTPLKKSSWVK